MSNVKIKLKKGDGSDYGYVKLGTGSDKKHFLGGAKESEATVFEQVSYKGKEGMHYYKVQGEDKYLDEHTRSGEVFPETPFWSVEKSSIHAWKINENEEMEAVYSSRGTGEVIGGPHSAKQDKIQKDHPNALFCNFGGYPYTVELVTV